MPVKLEHIRTPSDADWIDIEKIHKDTAPQQGLTSTPLEISTRIAAGDWMVAARFNDRIIGLLLVRQQDNQVLIDQAGVRTLTQRRGVMHQTITLLGQWATEQSLTLVCQNVPVALQTALEHRGFRSQDNLWIKTPDV